MLKPYTIAATLESEFAKYQVALELKGQEQYARHVGVIISLFAIVEGFVPRVLESLLGMDREDARSITGVFRAFSNRLDLIEQLIKGRDKGSVEREVFSYTKGLLAEANNIRNKFAHATYGYAGDHFKLETCSSNYNQARQIIDMTLDDFEKDILRLKRIISELQAILVRRELPPELHQRLRPQLHG